MGEKVSTFFKGAIKIFKCNGVENSLGFLLSKCHQKAFNMLRQKLEPYRITPPQFAVLSFLWEREGINQIQLGELMDVDNATISGILDRLEKIGYVRREKNTEDRRSFSLAVTEEGKEIRHELILLSMEHYKNLTKNLTEEEFDSLIKLLNKLKSK